MRKKIIILFFAIFGVLKADNKSFVVLITSFNNKNYWKKNIESVLGQSYQNFRILYVDDASKDQTGELVEQYIQENNLQQKIILIKNNKNVKKLANLYSVIHKFCQDYEIIIELDGDDWLAHSHVLQLFNETYQNEKIWITYGSYLNIRGNHKTLPSNITSTKPTPEFIITKKLYRETWIWSGLRSYYAFLFKKIRKSDLIYQTGKFAGSFFFASGDAAIMYPMLEMAGSHIAYLPDIVLFRNTETSLNDFKIHNSEQKQVRRILKNKKKYETLKSLF